ncbi:MAG TPA: TetR/AcrR family transcriptional regulator [Phycisphaerales bacterium]|nr:TetR/AcrR family transcriptional regulator [Phycisphaerales bacterium]
MAARGKVSTERRAGKGPKSPGKPGRSSAAAKGARAEQPPAPPAFGDAMPDPANMDTRSRILHVAFQLFHEQGYHATGIATILREASVNAGSLYHFFPSKEALLIGVLEYAVVMLRPAVMDPAERRTDDPVERVFELLQQYREGMHLWGCKMGCPIGNLALEVADDNVPARTLIHRNFENWALAVQKWLDDAGDRLPRSVDRGQLARFVLTVMEGGIMQARAAGNLGPFDDSVAQLRAYVRALEELAKKERGRK